MFFFSFLVDTTVKGNGLAVLMPLLQKADGLEVNKLG